MATNPNDNLSDRLLLDLFSSTRDAEYLGVLYNRYMPLVYGVCLKYLRSTDDAGDAVMQIFEELVAKMPRFDIKEFRPWLYTVAKNHCLGELRKTKREIPSDFSAPFMETADMTHLFDKRDDEARLAALENCMEKLPEGQKTSIRMFFFDGLSYADIAAATQYDYNGVKSHIQNGKRNLKICIESNAQ